VSKYSGKQASGTRASSPTAPIQTVDETTSTYEGDLGFLRTPQAELFQLAVVNMGEGEDTFYEPSDERQRRYVGRVHQVTRADPKWMQQFIPWLRTAGFMRTASVVAAVEYARAGGPEARRVISRAISRADDLSETLGYYWHTNNGRKTLMASLRRGLADASVRVLTPYNAMKYDGASRGVRLGDVIEVTHPQATTPEQHALFEYLLDRRHHSNSLRVDLNQIPVIRRARELQEIPQDQRRYYLRTHGSGVLLEAGMTWERLSEWIPGGMDAEAWEWIIPNMGYMALLRNLRNFDQAGISDLTVQAVIAKLTNPEEVARSMQFPYRFYSAYSNVASLRWAQALETALDLSTSNIPSLDGPSLVLVDVSFSMCDRVSRHSTMSLWEAGALFGVAQFIRAGCNGKLVAFATNDQEVRMDRGSSVLRGIEKVRAIQGTVGGGTNTWPTLRKHYSQEFRRVLIFTDMQSFGSPHRDVLSEIKVPIYNFNLAGYRVANMEVGANGRYEMGGFSDATFRQIAMIESAQRGKWPWEE